MSANQLLIVRKARFFLRLHVCRVQTEHNFWVQCFFFQAEDGIRDAQESRGLVLGLDSPCCSRRCSSPSPRRCRLPRWARSPGNTTPVSGCLLYTSDAADEEDSVD